jgi:hypothetical protein
MACIRATAARPYQECRARVFLEQIDPAHRAAQRIDRTVARYLSISLNTPTRRVGAAERATQRLEGWPARWCGQGGPASLCDRCRAILSQRDRKTWQRVIRVFGPPRSRLPAAATALGQATSEGDPR